MDVFIVLWSCLLTTKLSNLQKNNFGHTKVLPQCQCSQEKLGAYIHLTYRATSQKVWHKHGAPQLGSLAKPVDKYGLLFDYRTVYAFKYVVYHQSLERLLYRLFFRQNSNHFCMSGRQQQGAGSRGQEGQGGQGSSRAGTGIDPPKGILIVLKKGCDWTKKCMAVYHQYIDISDNFLCCAMYKYAGIMSRQISVFVQLSIYQMFFQLK